MWHTCCERNAETLCSRLLYFYAARDAPQNYGWWTSKGGGHDFTLVTLQKHFEKPVFSSLTESTTTPATRSTRVAAVLQSNFLPEKPVERNRTHPSKSWNPIFPRKISDHNSNSMRVSVPLTHPHPFTLCVEICSGPCCTHFSGEERGRKRPKP